MNGSLRLCKQGMAGIIISHLHNKRDSRIKTMLLHCSEQPGYLISSPRFPVRSATNLPPSLGGRPKKSGPGLSLLPWPFFLSFPGYQRLSWRPDLLCALALG